MQLFIRSSFGETFCVKLDAESCTIGFLKSAVAQRLGIPEGKQRLVHAGKQVQNLYPDDSPLSACGIENDSTIRVLLRLPGGSMNIYVKVLGGKSITVNIPFPQATTIAYIQAQLKEMEGLETDKYELMFRGGKLVAERTLTSYQIGADATLDAVLPATRTSKGRCSIPDCCDRVAKVVGECRYCGLGYCSRHRLPESHACDNLQGCRQQSYEKNSSKLMDEKCVADKV